MTEKKILGTCKITHKFQITIPKEVRERHNFKESDRIVFVEDGDNIYMKKSTETY